MRGASIGDITVADIAKVRLAPPSGATPPVNVVRGGVVRFGMTRREAGGAEIVGYGTVPVEVAPVTAGAAVPASKSVGLFDARFSQAGNATLTGKGAGAIAVTVVPASDIAALAITVDAATGISRGAKTNVSVTATNATGDDLFGLSEVVALTSSTPNVCTLVQVKDAGDEVFSLTGRSAGSCELTATVGAVSAAATVTVQ